MPVHKEQVNQRDVEIVSQVVALVHARRKGDYLAATAAHHELERLGVSIRFSDTQAKDAERLGEVLPEVLRDIAQRGSLEGRQ